MRHTQNGTSSEAIEGLVDEPRLIFHHHLQLRHNPEWRNRHRSSLRLQDRLISHPATSPSMICAPPASKRRIRIIRRKIAADHGPGALGPSSSFANAHHFSRPYQPCLKGEASHDLEGHASYRLDVPAPYRPGPSPCSWWSRSWLSSEIENLCSLGTQLLRVQNVHI